ncbi:MAG: translocation/assembly module TamB [Bacteroidales bacterium]|nr:translocation/assembly module TamB [Bacteroidales bacterium]
MKHRNWALASLRVCGWVILGIVLLALGILLTLYSSWGQDKLRAGLLHVLNSHPGVEADIASLRLRFPLDLTIEDMYLVQQGDTMLKASRIEADVELAPLFAGDVNVRNLMLNKARFQLNNADSLMMMVIRADTLHVAPAKVELPKLHINLAHANIIGGKVALISRPDTANTPPTPADTTTTMRITVPDLKLKDFTYYMKMVPTMDSLGVHLATAQVSDILVDLQAQQVKVKTFNGDRLNASYIACNEQQIADNPLPPTTSDPTAKPWTVSLDTIHFANSEGLYTIKGWEPQPGLDFSYIQATDMDITVVDFYNQETTLRLPITLSGVERCGVELEANGTFSMDSTAMFFTDFDVATESTHLKANGMLGVGDLLTDPDLPLQLNASGNTGIPDLKKMFPLFDGYLSFLPDNTDAKLGVDLAGTAGAIDLREFALQLNGMVNLKGSGDILNAFSEEGPDATVKLHGDIIDINSILKSVLTGSELTIPPMTLDGQVTMVKGDIDGNLKAETKLGGNLALDASYRAKAEGYDLSLKTVDFPVDAFVKDMGIGKLTADIEAKGQGFDVFNDKTTLSARADVISVEYNKEPYKNVSLLAAIDEGKADVHLESDNKDLDLDIVASGNLSGQEYDWDLAINGRNIDLYNLKLSTEPAVVTVYMTGDAKVDMAKSSINAEIDLRDLMYTHQTGAISLSDVKANFDATDSLTHLTITNRDLNANLDIDCGISNLIVKADMITSLLDEQLSAWKLSPDTIQKALPRFDLFLTAGSDNMINDVLTDSKMSIQSLRMKIANDSAMSVMGRCIGFTTGTTTLDTIGMKLTQKQDKMQLIVKADNAPGTLDDFAHIRIDGLINTNQVALRGQQQNIQGQTGFDIGAMVSAADSTLNMRIFPLNPIIGYKNWTVNFDNYISYEVPHRHIDANLKMRSKDSTSELNLYTRHNDTSLTSADDIILQLKDVALSDWIVINPWAPPIQGNLSADLKVQWDGGDNINAQGDMTLADFKYDRQRVGTFKTDLNVATNTQGMVRADVDLLVDGKQAMTLNGVLNDSTKTSPFDLDLQLITFPLSIANPFLPPNVATLSGTLNGKMCVSGDMVQPLLNGNIDFDNASVKLYMTNTAYKFSDADIPVVNNLITFKDFSIYGTNENPLAINGTVDMSSFADPKIDLSMKANNMMLVNTTKAAKSAEIYGKAYITMDATAKGNMRFMAVNTNITVLSGTNVTYVMTDAAATIQSTQDSDMVHFVNFENPDQVALADTIAESGMILLLDANLTIQNATTINVDLSSSSRDKVQVMPEGSLTLSMTPLSDPRVTGRININEGMARYTIPVIGQEKEFTFDQGSYIAFNGDMLNPTLNVHATDVTKTNVTTSGNSRMVTFDILLGITGTLEQMDVKFDLETPDDITIANELQTMSADQRANQAMNLLLYNVYTGPGSKATANIGANPLFSFLESQVNNWAAQNIKGVDLSFGIDQYNQTNNGTTSSAMSYSYQVSKSLLNDRMKIVVGGNYTTDSNADENLSENLVNDIAIEYFLNEQRTMLLKLFRHTGYESILEGEITKTGVGFVYRRKVNRLVQILPRFLRPAKYKKII